MRGVDFTHFNLYLFHGYVHVINIYVYKARFYRHTFPWGHSIHTDTMTSLWKAR